MRMRGVLTVIKHVGFAHIEGHTRGDSGLAFRVKQTRLNRCSAAISNRSSSSTHCLNCLASEMWCLKYACSPSWPYVLTTNQSLRDLNLLPRGTCQSCNNRSIYSSSL